MMHQLYKLKQQQLMLCYPSAFSVFLLLHCIFVMYLFSRINHLRVRSEQIKIPFNEQTPLLNLAKKILQSPFKILAIDFDKTLIDDDSGSSMSFENIYIRNQFFWLIKYLIQDKWICITSFNENIPTVFNENLGKGQTILTDEIFLLDIFP